MNVLKNGKYIKIVDYIYHIPALHP